MHAKNLPVVMRIFAVLAFLDTPWMLAGGLAAVTGRRWGAYVLLGWIAVRIGMHLVVGTLSYREVMGRPWPPVAPLADDDWDG